MRATRVARNRRDPEVRGASVEVDHELLVGGTNGDRTVPEQIVFLVSQRDTVARGKMLRDRRDRFDPGAHVERLAAEIVLNVD